jgi:thioredoxin reductase
MYNNEFDVVIVGGGSAGLSAALVLGRSLRKVLVCDNGEPRNSPSHSMHSFLSRDGTDPLDLLRIARDQLKPYNTVKIRNIGVKQVNQNDKGFFDIEFVDSTRVVSKKILLCTGIVDELPNIQGFSELWGKAVLHCPYCHGWEVRGKPLAIYGKGQDGFSLTLLISNWSNNLVLCSNGPADLEEKDRKILALKRIEIYEQNIDRLEYSSVDKLDRIIFGDGSSLKKEALFIRPTQRQRSFLPTQLGCMMTESDKIKIDETGRTTVLGVYAAGDAVRTRQQVIMAASDGANAAITINQDMVDEDIIHVS